MKIRKAVIPAAGLGTRFLPASKAIPKELVPIVDKPCIQYIVEEALKSGVEEVVLITSRGKGAIEDHFDVSWELEQTLAKKGKEKLLKMVQGVSHLVKLTAVRQKEQLGLGHAVLCAKEVVGGEPFLVLLGDDLIEATPPCGQQMIEVWQKFGGAVVAIMEVPREEIHLYGSMKGEKVEERVYRIEDLVEKPRAEEAPSNLAVIGRYLLPPQIFEIIEETPPGSGGEIQLTDALKILAQRSAVYGYKFRGERFDAGDKLGFLKATIYYGLRHPELGGEFKRYLGMLEEGDD